MPQTFHAVQCCACETYQAQQVKKVAKFKCVVCGDKQSVRQVCRCAALLHTLPQFASAAVSPRLVNCMAPHLKCAILHSG